MTMKIIIIKIILYHYHRSNNDYNKTIIVTREIITFIITIMIMI